MDDIKDRSVARLLLMLEKVHGSPKELMKRGFLIGLASGIGGIIGAALVIILLGYLVSKLGGIPFIGNILQDLNEAVPN